MMISSNSQPQNSMASTKWTEIIEDFWKPFKNKDQLYDENYLKYDCIKLQFQIDDGEESDSDSESWLHPVSSDAEEAEAPLEMKSDSELLCTWHSQITVFCDLKIHFVHV